MSSEAEAGTVADVPEDETRRDRVRRLFINPMTDLGWRKPANVKIDQHAENLNRLADDLAYLGDEGFARLRAALRGKGDGKLRDAWPPRARIIAFAELVEPRPIMELPAMLRWFRSEAGRQAEAAGRLVEEYAFWCRHKRPPRGPGEYRSVADRAEANRHRAEVITDRVDRGVALDPEDHDWMRRYQDRLYQLRELVRGGAEGAA